MENKGSVYFLFILENENSALSEKKKISNICCIARETIWWVEARRLTCPTTCFPLIKASNPQTAAHSPNGKTYLASMGTALWLVYFWKMTTFWEEKHGRDASEEKPLTNNSIAKMVSFSPHLREQVHQFALHVDGLKGELLTGAVQKSRSDVLQRVRNRLQAVYLVTDHCTCKKNHPWRAALENWKISLSPFGNSGRTFRKILGIYLASPKGGGKTWNVIWQTLGQSDPVRFAATSQEASWLSSEWGCQTINSF